MLRRSSKSVNGRVCAVAVAAVLAVPQIAGAQAIPALDRRKR